MGDGEIAGTAIEVPLRARLQVTLDPNYAVVVSIDERFLPPRRNPE